MKITPIVSKDIIGRYNISNNSIIDTFTNKVLLNGKTSKLNKVLADINRIGLINSDRLQINATANKHLGLLYVVA